MKVYKCPHIRHINSCINITYDVIFLTPVCTQKPIKIIACLSLLKEMVHYYVFVMHYLIKIIILILNFITDGYQIKIGMIPPNYVHETNVF